MIRTACFLPWSGGYEPPSPIEIREFLRENHLTGAAAGAIMGVDGRTVRRWTADPDTPGARRIPYAAWRLLFLEIAPPGGSND